MIRLPAVLLLALLVLLGQSGQAWATPDDAESEDTGLPLLRKSAQAGRLQSYSGTLFSTSGKVVRVSNSSGGMSVDRRAVDPATLEGGLLAPSEGMLRTLAANFQVLVAGGATACGRSARLVEALRSDGRPAARFWIDDVSGLLLRREVLDGSGRVAGAEAFVDVDIAVARDLPPAAAGSAPAVDSDALARLRAGGWQFPNLLPGRLELFDAGEAEGFLKLGYSDGLSVVSVFVQRGRLDEERLKGWRSQRSDGHTIWVRESAGLELIWASGGHVYTVFADAPADVVEAAVAGLPHEAEPGFWARLGRGADRVLSWVNPFA